MPSLLSQLQSMTTIVADTGDIEAIRHHRPQDATTNPSLLLKAAALPEYEPLIEDAVGWAKARGGDMRDALDKLAVDVGLEVLKIVPGRISTEVDARLSFDTEATVCRSRKLIGLYNQSGIANDRVLIKIASTWEGIEAARQLEKEGIRCNLTLLFAFCQAVACGDAGIQLISPFVGRIYDWYKKSAGAQWNEAAMAGANDPGVKSVSQIYTYYKKFGIATEVMGASFRNVGQINALSGCDLLTISPDLLAQLQGTDAPVARALDAAAAKDAAIDEVHFDEAAFRWALNEDAMATEKLAEGIRAFAVDAGKLDRMILDLQAA